MLPESAAQILSPRVREAHVTEILLLGVPYDPVMGSPGANDNASGIAALLEISRLFQVVAPVLSIRFVVFVNEEPPFFRTAQQKRSMVYAQAVRRRGDDIRLMASLETIGSWKFSWDGFGLSLKGCSPATGCGLSGELRLFAANRIDLSVRPRGMGCDLIVMASHGRRGISAIVLGSETVKVLTHSTIPVLVYRGPRTKLPPYFAAS